LCGSGNECGELCGSLVGEAIADAEGKWCDGFHDGW
jgi:hypothetical protein